MGGTRELGAGISESGASGRTETDLERVPPRDRDRPRASPLASRKRSPAALDSAVARSTAEILGIELASALLADGGAFLADLRSGAGVGTSGTMMGVGMVGGAGWMDATEGIEGMGVMVGVG